MSRSRATAPAPRVAYQRPTGRGRRQGVTPGLSSGHPPTRATCRRATTSRLGKPRSAEPPWRRSRRGRSRPCSRCWRRRTSAAATLTVRQTPRPGAPVAGSMMWWRPVVGPSGAPWCSTSPAPPERGRDGLRSGRRGGAWSSATRTASRARRVARDREVAAEADEHAAAGYRRGRRGGAAGRRPAPWRWRRGRGSRRTRSLIRRRAGSTDDRPPSGDADRAQRSVGARERAEVAVVAREDQRTADGRIDDPAGQLRRAETCLDGLEEQRASRCARRPGSRSDGRARSPRGSGCTRGRSRRAPRRRRPARRASAFASVTRSCAVVPSARQDAPARTVVLMTRPTRSRGPAQAGAGWGRRPAERTAARAAQDHCRWPVRARDPGPGGGARGAPGCGRLRATCRRDP